MIIIKIHFFLEKSSWIVTLLLMREIQDKLFFLSTPAKFGKLSELNGDCLNFKTDLLQSLHIGLHKIGSSHQIRSSMLYYFFTTNFLTLPVYWTMF